MHRDVFSLIQIRIWHSLPNDSRNLIGILMPDFPSEIETLSEIRNGNEKAIWTRTDWPLYFEQTPIWSEIGTLILIWTRIWSGNEKWNVIVMKRQNQISSDFENEPVKRIESVIELRRRFRCL